MGPRFCSEGTEECLKDYKGQGGEVRLLTKC